MSRKPRFKVGQFATTVRYIPPALPSGTMVKIESVAAYATVVRYECTDIDGEKHAWVYQEDLE
jgi:hypothetical protein